MNDLREVIKGSSEPVKQVLNSILGEIYWKYYQLNRYRFHERSKLQNIQNDSIQTWDLTTLAGKITETYLASLDHPEILKSIPVTRYSEILLAAEKRDRSKEKSEIRDPFRPTLFDFLSWRALDYFMSPDGPQQAAASAFKIDDPAYFSQVPVFIKMNFAAGTAESRSPDYFAITIFHDLAAFHFNDKDPQALIDEELQRFSFLLRRTTIENRDSIYLSSLKQFEKDYSWSPWSTDISYAIAQVLYASGQEYRPLISDRHKWDIRSAAEFCEAAMKRFPKSDGARNCKTLDERIRQASVEIKTEFGTVPEKPSLALLSFKNVPEVWFRIVKADPEETMKKTANMRQEEILKYYLGLPVAKDWQMTMPSDGDRQVHSAEISIPEVPSGYYILICSSDKDFLKAGRAIAYSFFYSTHISYISQRSEKGGYDFYFLDRETGLPLKNVSAEAWTKAYDYRSRTYETRKLNDFSSDENGFFSIPPLTTGSNYSGFYLKLKWNSDVLITDNLYQYPYAEQPPKPALRTSFFTDRAIYRPGQTIYFKGILLEQTGEHYRIMPGQTTSVTFTDANYQKISEQTFVTNDFGSFNGSFTAPQGVLLGQMTISNGSGSISVSVEEYKRPTFEVSFDPPEGNYRLNDTITLKGKAIAYAGNYIDAALVKYRVVRTARFPFWSRGWYIPFPVSPEIEITNGTVKTDNQGKFTLKFRAIPDGAITKTDNPVFDYHIFADVTDLNGETQSDENYLSVGYTSLLIDAGVPDKVSKDTDTTFKLTSVNLNGRPTPAVVSVTIQRLKQPDRAFKKRLWETPDLSIMSRQEFYSQFPYDVYDNEDDQGKWPVEETILEKIMNTATDTMLRIAEHMTSLKQGTYLLTLKSKDPYGQDVEKKRFFTIYSPSSKEMPVNALNWFVPLKITGEPGEKARFLIGSKEENVSVVYEIRVHDSLQSRQWLKLNDRQMVVEIPILGSWRGNFSVNFVFIKHNRAFQNSQVVTVPYTNKKLNIRYETFRNKLVPGTTEEWRITVSDAAKKGAEAEFLTTMYDQSLDVFAPNNWYFSLYRTYYSFHPWETGNSIRLSPGSHIPSVLAGSEIIGREYLQLNWFGLSYFGMGGLYSRAGGKSSLKETSTAAMMAGEQAPPAMDQAATAQTESVVANNPEAQGKIPSKPFVNQGPQVRRDFRETAFFYPSLQTDREGNLVVKFTIPESLTKWKILGFAHTKDLDYGLVEKEAITQKDLMVFPNAPRFVRQGDTVVFSAKVVNLSDHALSGDVSLEFSNPVTQTQIMLRAPDPKSRIPHPASFSINKAISAVVTWYLIIPADPQLSMLQYRITATAGNFSDAEEKAFPVLTNRMLVTESVPLPVRGKGTFDFSFEKLLNSGTTPGKDNTLKNYKLTLEFASNPAWYAVQALSTLDEPKYPNADNIFHAFYANSIASFIANSNPKIRQVFESWKSTSPDALRSNLEKNQQLKSALLQETPWVMEAKSESERKQRLALLFDLNTLSNNLNENLARLKKLQSPNGAWPWFDGMPESRYITQDIVTGLGHLDHLGIKKLKEDFSTWDMITKAIRYLDGELVKDYEDLKKNYPTKLDDNHLGTTQVQYLYSRSYFLKDLPISSSIPASPAGRQHPASSIEKAFNYFQQQAAKYWLKTDLYSQGMIALALNRLSVKDVPQNILKSLSERALHSQELGMYWAMAGGYEWYQAPVETQAVLIEAYDEVTSDRKAVEEMKIWLLKQKQTQDWKTGRATAEACYALLLRGMDLLAETPDVKISVGKEKIDESGLTDNKAEAGTGYFQISWSGNEITPGMGKVSVTKSGEGVAWGALYWQYFEDLDKITPHQTPLKVSRKLFLEKNTPSGPVLSEIPDESTLSVGDKIKVRIILVADRSMEYIHMKDMRASAFEPVIRPGEGLSGYRYQDGLGYYQTTTDVATNFFFNYLPKGTYVFEYPLIVNAAGEYSNGITTVQCMYAPEFSAHSEGLRVKVK